MLQNQNVLIDIINCMNPNSIDKIFKAAGEIKLSKEKVIDRFSSIFSLGNISKLTKEEFLSFLKFKNNHHWTMLNRNGNAVTNDMDLLKSKLQVLLNSNIPLAERYDEANKINGMGKGIITAILHVSNSTEYGVWNGTVGVGMTSFNIWPNFKHGISDGEKYATLNQRLKSIARELNIDLWTLDTLWWVISQKDITGQDISEFSEEEKEYSEGKAMYRTHISYERDPNLVQKKKQEAIEKCTLYCEICGFDFEKTYGKIGKGFIECHHIIPVSKYDSKTKNKTTLDDLALVCSNCHRMLHRKPDLQLGDISTLLRKT